MTPRKNREGAASRRQRLQSSLPSDCPPSRCESFKPLSLPAASAASVPPVLVPSFGLLYPLPRGMSIEFPPFSARRSGSGARALGAATARSHTRDRIDLALHYAELFCAEIAKFVVFHRAGLFTFTDSVLYYSRSGNAGESRAPAPNGIVEKREQILRSVCVWQHSSSALSSCLWAPPSTARSAKRCLAPMTGRLRPIPNRTAWTMSPCPSGRIC